MVFLLLIAVQRATLRNSLGVKGAIQTQLKVSIFARVQ
jgi:hypothetical protein